MVWASKSKGKFKNKLFEIRVIGFVFQRKKQKMKKDNENKIKLFGILRAVERKRERSGILISYGKVQEIDFFGN